MLCWTQKGKKGTQHFSSIPFPLGQRSTSCSAFILISGCNEEKCENFLHKEILYEDSLDLRVCTLKTFKSPSMKLKWSISWPCVVLGWCLEGHLQDLSAMLNDFLFIWTFRIRESFLASILKDPYFFAGIFFASSFGIGIWCCVAAFFCYSLLRRSSVKREFGNSGGITSSPFGIPMRSVCITSKERRRRHPSCFESCFSNRWSKKRKGESQPGILAERK